MFPIIKCSILSKLCLNFDIASASKTPACFTTKTSLKSHILYRLYILFLRTTSVGLFSVYIIMYTCKSRSKNFPQTNKYKCTCTSIDTTYLFKNSTSTNLTGVPIKCNFRSNSSLKNTSGIESVSAPRTTINKIVHHQRPVNQGTL